MSDNIEARHICDLNTDPELNTRLAKWFRSVEMRNTDFEEWFAKQSTGPVACTRHPDVMRAVDRSGTMESDRKEPGQWALVYRPCTVCMEDQRLLSSGVSDVLLHARFENFEPANDTEKEHVNTARKFTEGGCGFLVLVGNVGTGKSHLAVACMRSFEKPVFLKQSTLLRMLRETYGNKKAVDPVEVCQNTSLLVLDEIGLSSGGRDELPMLHEILDHRYGFKKPTVLTCNLALEQLSDVLGDRLVDRIRECAFAVLSFGGKSHRTVAKSRYFDGNTVKTDKPWWERDIRKCF